MNEKRFIGSSGGVYDQYKSDRFAWSEWEEIIQIMNNLNEKAIERSKALSKLQKENEQLKQFKENVIKWLDSQMKFNAKKYIETEDSHFKNENIDLHNFKVFIGIDSDD